MSAKYKIITIDGPAGTGKSTAAKRLASAIGFSYFDTGALYRAITWKVLQEKLSLDDKKNFDALLRKFTFHIKKGRYFVEDVDVTTAIRTKEVTALVSEVSALSKVRETLKPIQIAVAKETDAVFEGRDLGTVVFPHSDLKFFLTAEPKVRAKRRFKELQEKFPHQKFSFEKILKDIQERDLFDSSRAVAPLKQAEDALLIDTSALSIQEVIALMKSHYDQRIKK